ncbi:HIT family protein|uniref:HIT family protein n=1 Tax=Noviherbaspirillum sp. L7-7A TaxID=2850560 RepID=UPI001C2C4B7D|nr:HIT family protein [Noviherbaspirillum sp. L7-7A]MBV0880132.1 HIT family protein [Noviherbaspirillum sp. L7-7A]
MTAACELCEGSGGEELYRDHQLRVVLVDDAQYPGFCRVIWQTHVKEMTDLAPTERSAMMQMVMKVETALREAMNPDKINLASLGNMTPHLHWHVIPRFADDVHFPSPVWANAQRAADAATLASRKAQLDALRAALARQTAQ